MKSQLDIIKDKIISANELAALLSYWRFKDQKIVFTNGCFDILHPGHIDYLAKASDLGDRLVIGLNTDTSVKLLGKDDNRPLQNENSRALILAALHFTDAIILFDEPTPLELIKIIQPHVLVKGSDYKINEIVGGEYVLNNGGEVKTIDFLPGFSTTAIVNKIKD